MHKPIKVGISSCLLGNKVRFDGGDKHNRYITKTLSDYFEYISFCPEAEAGMGIPRPPIHLVNMDNVIYARDVRDHSIDHTKQLLQFCETTATRLAPLCGFILKKDSPSCGMERVKVFSGQHPKSPPERNGSGIFAQYLKDRHPLLPLEEEGRLTDPVLRENFIERVFVYHRWKVLTSQPFTLHDLLNFHSDHKYMVMAHDQAKAKTVGQLLANADHLELEEIQHEYIHQLMDLLKIRVSRGRHANVLSHIMGYLRKELDSGDRAELVETIEQYQQGYVPLIVPITLLKHHFRRHPNPYIERQYYLNPHPAELMLRNQL